VRSLRRRRVGTAERTTAKSVIVEAIPTAIDKASGGGRYRYSLRQLFYAIRPTFLELIGTEPGYGYFGQVITGYEAELGHDLDGIYRDDRGVLYHPHLQEDIPLGTRSVEEYERPKWTFNKILYCEKEGFFPILKDAEWPERHDCALLTSKGFAGRAARDVLDLLADSDEDITFFCIHDADGPGTVIYQTLTQATKARKARRVHVVNLGLEPKEAIEMELPVEAVQRKDRKAVPVADYVESEWKRWLQKYRVELNAMDTPTFLAWLDEKMAEYPGKLVPPVAVLSERLDLDVKTLLRQKLTEEAIRHARIDQRTEEAFSSLAAERDRTTAKLKTVPRLLARDPASPWTKPVTSFAEKIVGRFFDGI